VLRKEKAKLKEQERKNREKARSQNKANSAGMFGFEFGFRRIFLYTSGVLFHVVH